MQNLNKFVHYSCNLQRANMGQKNSVPNFLVKYKFLIFGVLFLFLVYQYRHLRPDWTTINFDHDDLTDLEFVEQIMDKLPQDDARLIRYVRNRYLIPPSKLAYNFKTPGQNAKTEYSEWVRKFYKDKRGGIFIEAGANEGEVHSHSLDLELDLGWTGLLVECNPTVTPYLRSKHRKAWVAGVCASTTGFPGVFNFSNPENWSYSGRFGAAWDLPVKTNWTYFDVESVPLYTIIRAAGIREVDYFSFDVEGAELEILKTFPFDKVVIKVLILEVQFLAAEQRAELQKLLEANKLHLVKSIGADQIYLHEVVLGDYEAVVVT